MHNASARLHGLITRNGKTLDIPVEPVQVEIKKLKPKVVRLNVAWPCLMPTSWVNRLCTDGGKYLLGGHCLGEHGPMLTHFWEGYRETDPDHPVHESGQDLSTHVPCMIHGDEGRAKGKVPTLAS